MTPGSTYTAATASIQGNRRVPRSRNERGTMSNAIHSDPEILGGTPVFVGTRVPLKNLIDYVAGGYALDEFLDDFPSVTREQAVAALREVEEGQPG